MEGKKEKIFPWMKDVLQSFATSFMVDYNSDVLSILHRNIDKEINMIYSSNDRTIERTEALYKEITYIYEHMRLKISQHPEFQNATLSCVKLISQLIRVGLILTQGLVNSEWIERILTALELFPGEKVLVYDALFLVNGLKKVHQKPYCAILRRIMTEDHHEFVTDPLVYMEIILLFRRLKALVLNRYKEKYNILVTKIKPPSNLISWLASLDVNGYSPYLKNLKYKKIAQQLMKKALPESFIKKIRYMALNQYNFEIDDSELKIPETKNQSSSMFIIDNTSSTKCDNLDMLENSHKAITKKTNSQARRKRKQLLLNENIENSQSNSGNKSSNICIKESDIDNNNHKHFSKSNKYTVMSKKKQKSNLSNLNEQIIVSKKKKKSKPNLVKNCKSKSSTNLNKDVSDNDLFFQDVEGSTLLHDIDGSTLFQENKSTLNKEDPDSSSENKISVLYINESDKNIASNKHSPNSTKHITVSKKKKKLKSKNTKSCASATVNKDVTSSDLFVHGVENNSISEQLNKSILNDKDSESTCEIKVSSVHIDSSDTDQTIHKHFSSSNEHIVSKKKKKSKCNLIKNTDSEPSAIHSNEVPDNALFFHDVEGSSNSKKLKATYNISNCNISSKRDLSEDTDTLGKNVSKNKICKKLKSSKDGERTISDSSLSNNNKLDSNIVSHQQLMSENKNNKLENSFKDDENIIFETEVSGKKRKNITSIDDSASDDKCIYFKKLMLQKVSNQCKNTSSEISKEHKNVNSAVTEADYSKMPGIKEKNKNVIENTPYGNQSVHSENARVKNLEENVIINQSLSATENENKTVPLKSVVNENFEEGKNAISNNLSDHSDKFNDFIHPKNTDNLSTEKENILIVQSSEKTELLIEPKITDESSTHGARTQTTEESNNTFDNLCSEWIGEDNLVKNKQFNVLLLKSDISSTSVSKVECKGIENKHNIKESGDTLKSNQTANEESRPSTICPSATDVSENIPEPSQNVDIKDNENNTPEKDMLSNKYTFTITECADLPIMAKGIANKTQQMSDPNTHTFIAESSTSFDSSSCKNSIITQHNENKKQNAFSVEKTLDSKILDESSCKTNLKSVDTQISLEHETQKYISAVYNSTLLPTSPLDPMQSESKSLLNDSHTKNVVNNEHSVENSSVVESESKLEFKENSAENICSNESFDKACLVNIDKDNTLIEEISENNILHPIDQPDKSVQNNINAKLKLDKYIDTGADAAGDSENCVYKTKCAETTYVSPEEEGVCSDNKNVEENSLECESSKSLNIKEKLLIAEVSILDRQIKHDDISMNLSIKTTVSDKENNEISSKLENVKNANQKCVEKTTEFEAMQKALHRGEDKEVCHHVEDNAEHSIISIVKKQEEKSEKKDTQALHKLNDEKISSMLVNERPVHENSVLNSQSDIISNERIILNENILISNKLASLDTVNNSVNNVEIFVKGKDYTLQVVESEKVSDVSENSEKKDVLNSQIYIVKDNENSKDNLSTEITLSSNESSCSDNICNLENKVEISRKEEPQSLLKSKSVVITSENSDKLKVVNSQDDITISNKNNEKELLNENIPSSNGCSNKISNSSDNIKTSIEIMDSTIHSLPLIEKPVDACRNSDMFSTVNSQDDSILGNENCERNSFCENIPSLKESTSLDDIGNPENDVEIVESTVYLLPVIEKPNDVHENSNQLNSIDSLISLKNPTSSDNLDNDANNVQVVKSIVHLSPVIEKPVDACENSGELNSINSKDVSLKESTSSDNLDNPENDVKIVESTDHLLPVIGKNIDAFENADQLKAVISQNDTIIHNENNLLNENIPSSKECSDNIYNSANDFKVTGEITKNNIHSVTVIKNKTVPCENSDELKAVNYQDDNVTIGNKKDLLNESSSFSKECSDNLNNPTNDIKIADEIIKNAIHSLPVIEKSIVACENSDMLKVVNSQDDNEKDLSNKNSSSQKESTSSDNIHNSENDVKIPELINNTIPASSLNKQIVDICENSHKLSVVNSQNDCIRDDENNETDLSNDKNVTSSVKKKEDSLQLLESKNVEETPLNIKNTSSKKIALEVKTSSLCVKSNLNEPMKSYEKMSKDNECEKSCERMSKDSGSDADCNFDFQEPYIVLDESYSDVDDCKSNYSEQSIENCSPLKKTVTANNKSKFKLLPSNDLKIESIVKENISEVSLQKGTNEIDSIILPIKSDATDKSEIKSDISSSNEKSNHLHEKDTSEASHRSYSNDIDNATSPLNAAAASESKFEGTLSSTAECHKHLCVKDDLQTKQTLKKDASEVPQENCASRIDGSNSHESSLSDIKKDVEHSLEDSDSKEKLISAVHNRCSSVLQTEFPKKEIKFAEISEQIIKRMKKKSIEYPSEVSESLSVTSFCNDKNRESFTEISVKNKDKSLDTKSVDSVPTNHFPYDPSTEFFSVYKNKLVNDKDNKTNASLSSRGQTFTEIPFKDEDKNIDIESKGSVPIGNFTSTSSVELSENKLTNEEDNKTKASLTSSNQSLTEIPFKNKDLDIETVSSVPINNFSSSIVASTESFGMYRNELTNDEDNKTEASLSSRDDILSNYQENDEIKSQTFSSDHSDDDDDDDYDFRYSSQEKEKDNCADDTVIPSEDCNDQSKIIDESFSFKSNVPSTAETENDSLDNKNCAKDKSLSGLDVSDSLDSTHEKNSVTSVLPRQSLRLKTKAESKCQTDSGEISTSNISKIQEMSKKELKLVLVDCKTNLETVNNTNNLSIENTFSCPLTHDNKEDIISSQTSVIKKSTIAKDKSKESSTDFNKSAKRYSLQHRKSNRPRDESANLGIDLNKLKFDSPKCTQSTRRSNYVKSLTSPPDDTKLQNNPSDVTPSKRETRSSAKSDVGIEPNTPSYNLRNRKAIIAPAKFNV